MADQQPAGTLSATDIGKIVSLGGCQDEGRRWSIVAPLVAVEHTLPRAYAANEDPLEQGQTSLTLDLDGQRVSVEVESDVAVEVEP